MKQFVLMNKKTGNLLIGIRVCFLDQDWCDDLPVANQSWQIGVMQHDGWIVELPPEVSQFRVFFNQELENMVEVLGEL